jgi:Uma2 family endonuclease
MGPEEREQVVESLPNEVTDREMSPPEGDLHQDAKHGALDMLRGYFRQRRRKVYVGSELPVYYPGEPRFAPDLLVVFDVENHKRGKWLVSHEGKGLDWVMEVHVGGDRKKDAEINVRRNARLGIPEYFICDLSRQELVAYHLKTPGSRRYTRMKPRQGRYVSEVLGLELELRDGELFMWAGRTLLLQSSVRADLEAQRRKEALQRSKQEAQRRKEVERLLTAEAKRLKKTERLLEEAERRRQEAEQQLAALKAELRKRRPRAH